MTCELRATSLDPVRVTLQSGPSQGKSRDMLFSQAVVEQKLEARLGNGYFSKYNHDAFN